ncbi:3-deoxy-manno-octulosonate cytidylyltransferase [Aliikangiella sp. IMCC44653]
MNDFHVIIPARYHSTRLPAKALAKIGPRSMVEHVCLRASESGAASVTVATDHQLIYDQVIQAGFNAVMTKIEHPSGSDRLFEAAELIGLEDKDVIVNVQGDEPFIPPQNIALVASLLSKQDFPMATLCCKINSAEEVLDPNSVKVIFNKNQSALYFSRSPIPYSREKPLTIDSQLSDDYYRHIGIYAYRKVFLKQYIHWPQGQLETMESLEQLRVLENGAKIGVACLDSAPPAGVDTEQDLKAANLYYNQSMVS